MEISHGKWHHHNKEDLCTRGGFLMSVLTTVKFSSIGDEHR